MAEKLKIIPLGGLDEIGKNMIALRQFCQQLHTVAVWRHNRAANVKIAPGNSLHNVFRLLIHHLPGGLDSAAVFKADHYASQIFDDPHGLFQNPADWAPGNQDPLGAGRHRTLSPLIGFHNLASQLFQRLQDFLPMQPESGTLQGLV